MNSFAEYSLYELIEFVPYIILNTLSIIFGVFGNLLIMGSIFTNKDLHSITGGIILNLSAADLIISSATGSFALMGIIGGKEFYDKFPWLCNMAATSCFVFCTVSFLNMCLLAFNRYICICYMGIYKKVFSKKQTIAYCIVTWFIGFALDSPNFLTKNGQHFDVKLFSCMFNQDVNEAYIRFIFLLIMFGLGVFLPFFYFKIFKKVTLSRSRSLGYNNFRKNEMEQIHKTTKGIYYSFLFFSCSFVPFCVLVLIRNHQKIVPRFIYLYMFLIVRSNSVFNPILYATTNSHFKKSLEGFYDILSCKKHDKGMLTNETTKSSKGGGNEIIKFSKEGGDNNQIDSEIIKNSS